MFDSGVIIVLICPACQQPNANKMNHLQRNPLSAAIAISLRPYQSDAEAGIYEKWKTCQNVLAVLPTGAGKTVLLSKIVSDEAGASCVIAHRQELVMQISIALARNGVEHRIIAAEKTIKLIIRQHVRELGRNFHNPQSQVAVAGVRTLLNRANAGKLSKWLPTVRLWVQDEAHHVLEANQWGEAAEIFPNARGLGVTATPCRADGCGLGRHADGLFDAMVVGPTMRDLIDMGYLTEYRIICPPSNIDYSALKVGSTGDFTQASASSAVSGSSLVTTDGKSRVVGDVVTNYIKFATGKLGITFVPDVSIANAVAEQYNAAGVPAKVVSAKTPDDERARILEDFRDRKLMNLVNVDLFGEGFDLPAIEVVSMARPTQSYSLYVQQFGRALRLMDGKERAIIIDHVGNVDRHRLPDVPREWSLDRREKRASSSSDATPVRTCTNDECMIVYERFKTVCPECGTEVPAPDNRTGPEYVDGDLYELDDATLARMRAEAFDDITTDLDDKVNRYRRNLEASNAPYIVKNVRNFANKEIAKREAAGTLRDSMAWWAGYHRAAGRSDKEIYRIFYLTFDIDWLSAMAQDAKSAHQLYDRVTMDMARLM